MRVSFYVIDNYLSHVSHVPLSNPDKGSVKQKKTAEGAKVALYARLCWKGHKLKYSIQKSVRLDWWDKDSQRVSDSIKVDTRIRIAINPFLDKFETDAEVLAEQFASANGNRYPTPDQMRELLNAIHRPGPEQVRPTLVSYCDGYIQRCKTGAITRADGKKIAAGTIKSYETTLYNIRLYNEHMKKELYFEDIDLKFYASFTEFLTKKRNQALNSVGKHIRVIKSIRARAIDDKVCSDTKLSGRFKAVSEEADTIYLTASELQRVAELDLSANERLEVVRDLFIIGCNTGLRFSDLSTLRPEQIDRGAKMITITQIKTGDPVVIPVADIVLQIMDKYGGKLPPARSNQKANAYIKEVCQQVPMLQSLVSKSRTQGGDTVTETVAKWELVSSHTARRSFATNEYLAGTPTLTIMAITGHRSEKSFLKYIKVTADQHAKILQNIWAERNNQPTKRIAI